MCCEPIPLVAGCRGQAGRFTLGRAIGPPVLIFKPGEPMPRYRRVCKPAWEVKPGDLMETADAVFEPVVEVRRFLLTGEFNGEQLADAPRVAIHIDGRDEPYFESSERQFTLMRPRRKAA